MERASAETVEKWLELARQVREALDLAGIPHHFADDLPRPAGAEVEIDHGDDEAGGVFVDWRPGAALDGLVVEATGAGHVDDPATQLFMTVATSMRDAMAEILRASGFDVVPIDDYDLRPPAIHVLGR